MKAKMVVDINYYVRGYQQDTSFISISTVQQFNIQQESITQSTNHQLQQQQRKKAKFYASHSHSHSY